MKGNHSRGRHQSICRHYFTGTCKFGAMCKFRHPGGEAGIATSVCLNVLGYPLRLNAVNCSFYVKNGCCKFGSLCKFNHPQPFSDAVPLSSSAVTPIHSPAGQLAFPGASVVSSPSYALPQQTISVPSWNACNDWMGYIQPSLTQLQTACNDQNDGASFQIEGIIDMGSKYGYGSPLLGHYVFRSGNASFPERPGLPECQFYMRRGTCRFGETCKFHHPRQRIVPACILSPRGLPLRPGYQVCRFYSRFGICKYGVCCKFDHPMDAFSRTPVSSSVDSTAVHPVTGSSSGTVASMDTYIYPAASSSVDSMASYPAMCPPSGTDACMDAFLYAIALTPFESMVVHPFSGSSSGAIAFSYFNDGVEPGFNWQMASFVGGNVEPSDNNCN